MAKQLDQSVGLTGFDSTDGLDYQIIERPATLLRWPHP